MVAKSRVAWTNVLSHRWVGRTKEHIRFRRMHNCERVRQRKLFRRQYMPSDLRRERLCPVPLYLKRFSNSLTKRITVVGEPHSRRELGGILSAVGKDNQL